MEIKDYTQLIEAKDIIFRKLDTCKKLDLISRYSFDISISDGDCATIEATIKQSCFDKYPMKWSASCDTENFDADEDSFNAMSDFLDEQLKAAVEKTQAAAKILQDYYNE